MAGLSDDEIHNRLEAITKIKFKEFAIDVKRINPKLRCTPVSRMFEYIFPAIP